MPLPPEAWPRLKEVFAGARALALDARPAYLAAACGGDEALRQEVEMLLASHEQAASILETPSVPRHVRFHDARHTALTRLAEAGQPEWVIQAQLGHVSPSMMKTYSHLGGRLWMPPPRYSNLCSLSRPPESKERWR